ncbi:MAG: ABC transporter ATP-binding protein [Spirochaetales bacterium]|nr:ABC transporter ATP-binding protein [Spirochaetales bacterium]
MIRAEGLTKRYGRHVAIDHLDFSIDKGEILGFLGPNGAGKTTTMNIITGYLSASEGRITVDGIDVLEQPEEVKRHIGYLPEQPPLYVDMTVSEYLSFVGQIKKVPKGQMKLDMEKIMDLVKIHDVQKRLIKNLSKGYKQRVGLAQALIGNPRLLILDEPTVGLDPKQIIEIRNLIKELRQDHTIVLSSHILPEVSAVCERVLIISKGAIVATDTPENLSRRLVGSNRLAVRARGSESAVTKALSGIKGVKNVTVQSPAEEGACDVLVEADTDRDIREDVFSSLVTASAPILLMRPMDLSLEDIFLHLTTSEQEVDQ